MPKVLAENTSSAPRVFYGVMLQPGESRLLEIWPDAPKRELGNVRQDLDTRSLVNEARAPITVPMVVAQFGIGVMIVGLNGTTDAVSAGGLLTFAKAITGSNPGQYFGDNTTGGGWFWLPAGMVVGRGAGLHYGIQKSANTVQLHNLFVSDLNAASTFVPYTPAVLPTTAVGTATAVAGAGGAKFLAGIPVPANSLGPNGTLRVTLMADGQGGQPFLQTQVPGPIALKSNSYNAGTKSIMEQSVMWMRGNTGRAASYTQGYQTSWSGNPGDVVTYPFDSTVSQLVSVQASCVATTDHLILNGVSVEALFQ
jgi:hypothetical protein